MLFAALTGAPPFLRETVPATMLAHLHDQPPRASDTPGVSPDFDRVLARALAKAPEDRYPSAGDFGRAALAAAEGRSVTEEERSVARGAAAPTMRREEQLWSGPVDPDEPAGGGAPARQDLPRPRAAALAAAGAGGRARGGRGRASRSSRAAVTTSRRPARRSPRPRSSGSRNSFAAAYDDGGRRADRATC